LWCNDDPAARARAGKPPHAYPRPWYEFCFASIAAGLAEYRAFNAGSGEWLAAASGSGKD